jgi:putative ABC transport system substrate-binding protein
LFSAKGGVVQRRDFIRLMGCAAAAAFARPLAAAAQPAAKVYRVGSLSPAAPFAPDNFFGKAMIGGFAKHGYAVGRNIEFEFRGTRGHNENLPRVAQELVDAKVDVIFATGYPAAVAAKLSGLPTVITHAAGDPVATGLIASLARPGGNVTGISDNATELSAKRLQLLKEIAPGVRRVAMLWNKDDLGMTLRYQAAAKAAEALGVAVQPLGVREPDDFEEAFAAMNRSMPDAIMMVADSLTILNRNRVFAFAGAQKLPAIYEYEYFARDGGLMTYGPDLGECFVRATALGDRILKGAKPADLPFEQPTRYNFLVNLKTAKAMGLDVPANVLARADEVIE